MRFRKVIMTMAISEDSGNNNNIKRDPDHQGLQDEQMQGIYSPPGRAMSGGPSKWSTLPPPPPGPPPPGVAWEHHGPPPPPPMMEPTYAPLVKVRRVYICCSSQCVLDWLYFNLEGVFPVAQREHFRNSLVLLFSS